MRQASWIAFLFLALGLMTYEASLDETAQAFQEPLGLDGTTPIPPPKP